MNSIITEYYYRRPNDHYSNLLSFPFSSEILKRMGLAYGLDSGTCKPENLSKALTLVPPVLKPYIESKSVIKI